MKSTFFVLIFFLPLLVSASLNGEVDCAKSPQNTEQLQLFNAELLGYTESNLGTLSKEVGIYGKDDRREPTKTYPYTTIGKLTRNGPNCSGLCTATLISACHILTARHCVKPEAATANADIAKHIPGCAGSELFFEASNGKSVSINNKNLITGNDKNDEDFAVVKLDYLLGNELGYMSVMRKSSENLKDNTKLESLGFNGDINEGKNLTGDFNAVFVKNSKNPKILNMRADLWGGASGGPIIAYADNGVPYIAGVNARGVASFNLKTNQLKQKFLSDDTRKITDMTEGTASEAFYERMIKFMRANPCN